MARRSRTAATAPREILELMTWRRAGGGRGAAGEGRPVPPAAPCPRRARSVVWPASGRRLGATRCRVGGLQPARSSALPDSRVTVSRSSSRRSPGWSGHVPGGRVGRRPGGADIRFVARATRWRLGIVTRCPGTSRRRSSSPLSILDNFSLAMLGRGQPARLSSPAARAATDSGDFAQRRQIRSGRARLRSRRSAAATSRRCCSGAGSRPSRACSLLDDPTPRRRPADEGRAARVCGATSRARARSVLVRLDRAGRAQGDLRRGARLPRGGTCRPGWRPGAPTASRREAMFGRMARTSWPIFFDRTVARAGARALGMAPLRLRGAGVPPRGVVLILERGLDARLLPARRRCAALRRRRAVVVLDDRISHSGRRRRRRHRPTVGPLLGLINGDRLWRADGHLGEGPRC